MLRVVIDLQPSLPPLRVAALSDRNRAFHEHPGDDDQWVELALVDGQLVCPRCGRFEGANTRLGDYN